MGVAVCADRGVGASVGKSVGTIVDKSVGVTVGKGIDGGQEYCARWKRSGPVS